MPETFRTLQIEDVALALGAETGALVVAVPYTKRWTGASVALYAGAGTYEFKAKQTALLTPHRINGRIMFSALFPGVPAGDYRIFASGTHRQVSHVTIWPHEVAEIQWL
jgi:hypothetical protein